jgi:DNA-binding NtrC family response regulator
MECARRNEPFVVVDGTASRQHDLARWQRQESSPLGFADQGTLVLLDGAALPLDVQRLIAGALAERRPPWEQPAPLDVLLVLTGSTVPVDLVVQGRLDAGLASRLREAEPVVLPRLRERPEDLHALFTERLAREGLRARGRPVGIDPHAFARFVGLGNPMAIRRERNVAASTKWVPALRNIGQRYRFSEGRGQGIS